MTLLELAKEWGWAAAILLYFAPQVWKFFADRWFPERIHHTRRIEDRKDKDSQAIRETEATLLRARIEREDRESDQRLKLEERMVRAMEGLQTNSATMQQLLVTIQTQLTHHETFTFTSTQDIKAGIEKLEDMDSLRKKQAQLEREMLKITEPKIPKVDK